MDRSYKIAGSEPQTLTVGSGLDERDIRYLATHAGPPGLFWLSGFMSDMASTKATAIADWANRRDLSSTRFDYSGHGKSSGSMEFGTIGRWLEEAEAVFRSVTDGPQIVIGSSMGGYIALLLLRKLLNEKSDDATRIKALLLIAPAWDMTEELMWKRFSNDVQQEIVTRGVFRQPSAYASPYVISRELIEDGRKHLFARQPFEPKRPVTILQGREDADVPIAHTRELMTFLKGDKIRLVEIEDGVHRLSRPQDLDLLFAELDRPL